MNRKKAIVKFFKEGYFLIAVLVILCLVCLVLFGRSLYLVYLILRLTA